MNFIDTLKSVELVLASGDVPLVVGESGIGKTALAKKLSEKMLDSTHACNIYYLCYTNFSLNFILISLLKYLKDCISLSSRSSLCSIYV